MEKVSSNSPFQIPKNDPVKSQYPSNTYLEEEKNEHDKESSHSDLLLKVENLTKENKELQDIIATLGESHETRTEASGTESELVHGKTPSISSDLSDTECDALPNLRDVKAGLQNVTSLQESGIFEPQNELTDAMTQTTNFIDEEDCLLDINCWVNEPVTMSIENENTDLEGFETPKEFNSVVGIQTQISVEDVAAIRVQDLQESDEYLLSDIDDRIILSKTEYDAIVAEERNLKMKIEDLNAENEELTLKLAATETELEVVKKKPTTDDEKESMRGAFRVLEEKLQYTEKRSKEFFEEKCEYEEAENDARLMVQRLQSQLDANREMEALLSASLSQEQEFSRELQKCLRDMQLNEKEDNIIKENYIHEIKMSLEREKYQMLEIQTMKVHYFVFLFKLLVKEYFGHYYIPRITHGRKGLDVLSNDYSTKLCNYKNYIYRLRKISNISLFSCPPSLFVINRNTNRFNNNIRLCNESIFDTDNTQPILNNEAMEYAECDEMYEKNIYNLSDRENYYLQQIKMLQKEKKSLRNDYESNDGERYQQYISCKTELNRTGDELEKSESEKCKLIFKIEELQYHLQSAKQSNELRAENINIEYSTKIESLKREKRALAAECEKKLDCVRNAMRGQEVKMEELKRKLICIHLELAPYIDNTVRIDSSDSVTDDQQHISNLVKSEASLRDKILELQEKERAYMETISEADKIMSAHVTTYNERIKELEIKLNDNKSILRNLEELLDSMKNDLFVKGNCLASTKLQEFLAKLQLELGKLKISLIKNANVDNFMEISNIQGSDEQKTFDSEFYEKEDLLQKLLKLTTEKSGLSSQLQEAHEATRKMSEMLQNELYFRSRVEELESSETCLREDLKKCETRLAQKDRKYQDQINLHKEEKAGMKAEIEGTQREINHCKSSELAVKNEVVEMKNVIQSLKSDLQESSDENASCDSQHRVELTRLRSQLKMVNSQLIEVGGVNSDLKEKMTSTEILLNEVTEQLEDNQKRHEGDILALNLKISQKESNLEEMEAQLQQLKHNEAANELDGLAYLPFSDLNKTLSEISKGLKECAKCSDGYCSSIDALMEYAETFTHIINGRPGNSDSESESDKWKPCNLSKMTSENENNMEGDDVYRMSQLVDVYPSVPPRPRRDAKLKRKRKRNSNEESILDELEATLDAVKNNSSYRSKTKEMRKNIKALEKKVKVRENELKIADLEVTDLYGKLSVEKESLQTKQVEIYNLQNSMVTFRKEFLTTVENNEKARQDAEEKHKGEIEVMNKTSNELGNELSTLMRRTKERNHLLKHLIKMIRKEVCPNRLIIILSTILKFAINPEICDGDYTNEQLVEYLEHLIEQVSVHQSGLESATKNEYITDADDCSINPIRKSTIISKIPLIKPHYLLSLRKKLKNVDVKKQCIKKMCSVKMSVQSNMQNEAKSAKCIDNPPKQWNFQSTSKVEVKNIPIEENKKISLNSTNSSIIRGKSEIRNVNPKFGCNPNIFPVPKRSPTSMSQMGIPLQSKSPAVKDVLSSSKVIISSPKKCNDIHIPRPQNLRITRKVGIDGAVIAWNPVEDKCIAGFQVLVDGRVIQQLRTPKRTKALVYGLPFNNGFSISLAAISTEGRCSIPVTVTHEKPKEKRKNRTLTTFRCFNP